VRKLLGKLQEEHQVSLFHELLNSLEFRQIHGFSIITSYMKLSGQMAGLAAVIERVFEVEDADAYIAVFELEKENAHLLISRASNKRIDLNLIMNSFGGAGHPQAASALIKNSGGFPIYQHVFHVLNQRLNHALTGFELMRPATTVPESWSLMEAAIHLEETNNSGAR
jgi:tRNA nucleotidyltransferase (CCA-adding enzyme)